MRHPQLIQLICHLPKPVLELFTILFLTLEQSLRTRHLPIHQLHYTLEARTLLKQQLGLLGIALWWQELAEVGQGLAAHP